MSLPENDYQILKLTESFYNAYPNPRLLHKKEFDIRYRFSPLKYFHNELGIHREL